VAIKVSVIVAVYNPGSHIEELITSLLTQSLPPSEFEVIFVDDASTDGTPDRLQKLVDEHSNLHLFRNSPNSGWPGKPRNIGIDAAQGTYVFFADNDDWLPERALEYMYDFAEQHRSDVVIAKEIGHGHTLAWPTWRKTIPNARLGVDPVLRVLTPHKLFRKAVLDEHGIRFPEGRVRLEDHLFVMKAYFAADVISIYSDHPCYHWVSRDKQNASTRPVDPIDYYRNVETILDVVAANTEPGELRNTLYAHWYRLKMLRRFNSPAFLTMSDDDRRLLFDTIRRIVVDRFDVVMDAALDPADRIRAYLLRADRLDLLVALATIDRGVTAATKLTGLGWDDDRLRLTVTATLAYADGSPLLFDTSDDRVVRVLPEPLSAALPVEVRDMTARLRHVTASFVLRNRSDQVLQPVRADYTVELVPTGDHAAVRATATAVIDPGTVFAGGPLPPISDVLLRFAAFGWGAEKRVPFDAVVAARDGGVAREIDGRIVTPYGTQDFSNLSIRRAAPKRAKRSTSATPGRKVGLLDKARRATRTLRQRRP
jgi:glycosyltransferase involved in cell wall biosynthesis